MSDSKAVAVVSRPSTQVATTSLSTLASRIFNKSNHAGSAPAQVQHPLVQTAEAEQADANDTHARLASVHIAKAQQTFQRFGNDKVKQVVLERGWGSEPETIGFVAQLGYHITDLEQKLAIANAEIARLRGTRR
jgi:hypothetical protein